MAKRWQSSVKNACLRGPMTPRFSRRGRRTDRRGDGVPDKGPTGRHSGAAAVRERAWALSRRRGSRLGAEASRSNDSEAGLKMFRNGCFVLRTNHVTDRLYVEFVR